MLNVSREENVYFHAAQSCGGLGYHRSRQETDPNPLWLSQPILHEVSFEGVADYDAVEADVEKWGPNPDGNRKYMIRATRPAPSNVS
jgi:hypothetical protein